MSFLTQFVPLNSLNHQEPCTDLKHLDLFGVWTTANASKRDCHEVLTKIGNGVIGHSTQHKKWQPCLSFKGMGYIFYCHREPRNHEKKGVFWVSVSSKSKIKKRGWGISQTWSISLQPELACILWHTLIPLQGNVYLFLHFFIYNQYTSNVYN